MYQVVYTKKALRQERILKSKNKSSQRKVSQIIERIKEDPFFCGNNFELLPVSHPGCYSRRVSWTDRIVYRVDKERGVISIEGLVGHY